MLRAKPTPIGDEVVIEVQAWSIDGLAAVGDVTSTGDDATHSLSKRVLVTSVIPCGECDVCRRGGAAACPTAKRLGANDSGTLASHVVARARWLCPLEDGLEIADPRAAAVGGPAASAYAMYTRTGIAPGEPVVIVGDGPVARFLAEVAVSKGGVVIAVSAQSSRGDWLRERKCRVVDASDDNLADAVAAEAHEAGLGQRPWRVLDADIAPESRARALSLASTAGTVTFLAGGSAAHAPSDLELVWARGCSLIGVAGIHPDLLCEVAALAVRGDIDLPGGVDVVSADEVSIDQHGRLRSLASDRAIVVRM